MRLTLCIPTHHGRVETLRVLLDSIMSQALSLGGDVEVCISDNASADGTAEMVAEYALTSPLPIRYHRFDADQPGVRNFVHVVDMATAEWCWLVGSDDALLPNALNCALTAIRNNPAAVGITCNKVNFDKTLTAYHSVDHEIALPSHPERSRFLSADEAVDQLAIAYSYLSAHLFRRAAWCAVVQSYGIEPLVALRHFPHAFAFASMASRHNGWLWLADYLIIQRQDNFCVMDAVGGRAAAYAEELTHDLLAAYIAALGTDATARASIARRLFVIYWNPFAVMSYNLTRSERLAVYRLCAHWFRHVPLFWLTTAPLLLSPVLPRASAASGAVRQRSPALRAVLRLLRLEKGAAHTSPGRRAAAAFLTQTKGSTSVISN